MYRAYKLWRQNCLNGTWSTFCRKHFLSHQNLVQVEELKCQYIGNLSDAGFIARSADGDNGTTRYPKCPRVRFAQLEPHLDRFSDDASMVMAVIAAAMHPKLVYKDVGAVWKTLSSNAPVAIHPSSSNFLHGRKPDFGNASFLTFFNIQQSKRLCESSDRFVSLESSDRFVSLASADGLHGLGRCLGEWGCIGKGRHATLRRGGRQGQLFHTQQLRVLGLMALSTK